MIEALLYLQWQGFKNRLRVRLKRLKQPKYLLGAVIGGGYLALMLGGQFFQGRRAAKAPLALASPDTAMLFEMLGALLLLVVLIGAWVLPHERAALTFTEAEIAFLFPAPLPRRTLIHFKLLRSQAAILFTMLIFTIVFSRGRASPWIAALGWWIILSTINLHTLGASFARTMLLDRGITNWQRRLAVLAVVGLALGGVGLWAWRALPPLSAEALTSLQALGDYGRDLLTGGPLPYLLFPLRLVVRPYFAAGAADFALAAIPAFILLSLQYWWVARSDVAFEEASVEASRKLAEKIAAVRREGSAAAAATPKKPIRPPFHLAAAGPPHVAFLWKNLIGMGRWFTARFLFVILAVGVGVMVPAVGAGRGTSILTAAGVAAAALAGYASLFGPQIVRQDFRADLSLADVLKGYPLRGWQVALGEVLAPAVILAVVQWGLAIVAVGCFTQAPQTQEQASLVIAVGLGGALVLPALTLISVILLNAAALLFPAWVHLGRSGPRGIEVMGQQLLLVLGQMLALLAALLPAGLAFGLVVFLLRLVVGWPLAIPPAALVAALVLLAEASFGVWGLGRVFERLDVSEESTAAN